MKQILYVNGNDIVGKVKVRKLGLAELWKKNVMCSQRLVAEERF
jgi:hypothetical protein